MPVWIEWGHDVGDWRQDNSNENRRYVWLFTGSLVDGMTKLFRSEVSMAGEDKHQELYPHYGDWVEDPQYRTMYGLYVRLKPLTNKDPGRRPTTTSCPPTHIQYLQQACFKSHTIPVSRKGLTRLHTCQTPGEQLGCNKVMFHLQAYIHQCFSRLNRLSLPNTNPNIPQTFGIRISPRRRGLPQQACRFPTLLTQTTMIGQLSRGIKSYPALFPTPSPPPAPPQDQPFKVTHLKVHMGIRAAMSYSLRAMVCNISAHLHSFRTHKAQSRRDRL